MLEDLPLISEAMARGEVSFSKVRALTHAATPDNEADLLEFALAGSAANLERLVRGWKKLSRWDEAQQERRRHQSRCCSVLPDEDGMYVVRGRLDPEVGAALMRAVQAASDALFARTSRKNGDGRPSEEAPEPAQLRAGCGGSPRRACAGGRVWGWGGDRSRGGGRAAVGARIGNTAPVSGSQAERYQVVLHVEAATLTEEGEPGLSELEDGTRISAETARRLACDASRVGVSCDRVGSANGSAHGSDHGFVLDVGRKTRTIPPALRRALDARDRGCRFPACGLRFTNAHHIVHWADGGETKLGNTGLLCRRHHRRVHEGGYRVCSDRNGQVVFFTPKGKELFEAPQLTELAPDPVQALVRGNRERGITPDFSSGRPRWKRAWDIPWAIEAAAREAVDP